MNRRIRYPPGLFCADPDGVLPCLHDQAAMNGWRVADYEQRRAWWVLRQTRPELAELSIARRADAGRAAQAKILARAKRQPLAVIGKQVRA